MPEDRRGLSAALRARVHAILEVAHGGDATSRIVDLGLMALVAINVLAVILESVEELSTQHRALFASFELFSITVFSAEYALRVWSSVESAEPGQGGWRERLRYVLSPMALADLAAIAPFYLSALFAIDLRFLRVLRLLRILKLTRYSGAMGMLLEVLRLERRAFAASMFILGMVLIFAASGIYLCEHTAQPEVFASIPHAMWWAVTTLTTVGYGDVTPVTPLGRVFAGAVTIVGIGTVALPAGLLASGFGELHRRNRNRLEQEVSHALEDGVITGDEAAAYDALARRLGVDPEEAREIFSLAAEASDAAPRDGSCPHCGKALA